MSWDLVSVLSTNETPMNAIQSWKSDTMPWFILILFKTVATFAHNMSQKDVPGGVSLRILLRYNNKPSRNSSVTMSSPVLLCLSSIESKLYWIETISSRNAIGCSSVCLFRWTRLIRSVTSWVWQRIKVKLPSKFANPWIPRSFTTLWDADVRDNSLGASKNGFWVASIEPQRSALL